MKALLAALTILLTTAVQIYVMTDGIGQPWRLLNDESNAATLHYGQMHQQSGFEFTKGILWNKAGSYWNTGPAPTPFLHGPPLVGLLGYAVAQLSPENLTVGLRGAMIAITIATSLVFLLFC
ncbi:MAG: hypothetical protein AAB425_08075, partial [Bdellovibrionota bacterium]